MKNKYLELLGLSPGASKREIKSAYRKLSKVYHPDISKDQNAKEKFIEINEAYKFLMDVGPKPNNEPITYSYDPYAYEYDRWRRRAREYAQKKAREEIRLQNELIKKILRGFKVAAFIIVSFNVLLTIDYLLPKTAFDQEILGMANIYEQLRYSANYRYDEIYFEDFTMRFDKGQINLKNGYEEATVLATKIFRKPVSATITISGIARSYDQVYSVYAVFGYIIPAIFFVVIFYQFILKTLDHRLTLAITMIVLFLIQLVIFSLF